MSRRHRSSAVPERVSKRERRLKTHQERRALRTALTAAESPEEILDPPTVHHGPKSPEPVAAQRKGRFRYWKQKDWKRRTTRRRQRARAFVQTAEEP